jgi:outer membrane protein TolC
MRISRRILLAVICLLLAPGAQAQKVSFRDALDLALKHSTGMGIAQADQIHAHQTYLETRNAFIPQLTFGSGLANVWGYPMSIEGSAPSVFNISARSYLLNFGQNNFLRAARTDWDAASTLFDDQRQATLLETALTYIQLDQANAKLAALQRETEESGRLESISRERLQAGVDSKMDLTKASLNSARVRMRLAQVQGDVDLLRQRLAQLTGLDAHGLVTDIASVPPRPEVHQQDDLAARALANNAAIKAADERAKSAALRAGAEHRQLDPTIDLVGDYGLFTKYNGLDQLFPQGQFSRNNATLGLAIRVPFLNSAQRSHAAAADADAMKAQKQATALREQLSNETLRLQRTIDQLSAARDVAQLEFELAQAESEAVEPRIQAGNATIKDEVNAHIQADDKQSALFDAQFELDRARLQLLRNIGGLEGWAMQ